MHFRTPQHQLSKKIGKYKHDSHVNLLSETFQSNMYKNCRSGPETDIKCILATQKSKTISNASKMWKRQRQTDMSGESTAKSCFGSKSGQINSNIVKRVFVHLRNPRKCTKNMKHIRRWKMCKQLITELRMFVVFVSFLRYHAASVHRIHTHSVHHEQYSLLTSTDHICVCGSRA